MQIVQISEIITENRFCFFFDLLFLLTKSGQSEFDYPLSIRFESTNENTRLYKFYNFIYCFSVFLFFDALVRRVSYWDKHCWFFVVV